MQDERILTPPSRSSSSRRKTASSDVCRSEFCRSDVEEFQQALRHIRDCLSGKMAIDWANKQAGLAEPKEPEEPSFSSTRVLGVLKWVFVGFWLLFVICLLAISLLNLMPAWPLDGGRICWALFARLSGRAQFTLSACTFASFSFLLFLPQNAGALVLLLILFILFFAPNACHNARYTAAFIRNFPDPPATLQQFSERQLWERSRIIATTGTGTLAMRMLNTWSRIAILPKSPTPFRCFELYMLLWVITLVTAAGTHLRQDALGTSEALSLRIDVFLPG